jgi:hypothetical protein
LFAGDATNQAKPKLDETKKVKPLQFNENYDEKGNFEMLNERAEALAKNHPDLSKENIVNAAIQLVTSAG